VVAALAGCAGTATNMLAARTSTTMIASHLDFIFSAPLARSRTTKDLKLLFGTICRGRPRRGGQNGRSHEFRELDELILLPS
jgi:hypothetical protein